MARMGKGMAETIDQGHYVPSKAPSLSKGEFEQVGTFMDEGDMTTTMPRGTSVNMKTNKTQVGENS